MLKGLMPMTYRRPKSRIRSRTADSFHSRVPSPHPMRPSSVVSLTKRKFRHAVPVKKTSTFVIFMETLLPSTPSVQQPLFFSSRNHFPSECHPFLVIPRACDFFDLFVFSAHLAGCFQPPTKPSS